MKPRSFGSEISTKELCRPLRGAEISAQFVNRSSCFASSPQSEKEKIGRLSQKESVRKLGKKTK